MQWPWKKICVQANPASIVYLDFDLEAKANAAADALFAEEAEKAAASNLGKAQGTGKKGKGGR